MRKLIAIIALTLFGNFGVAVAQKLAHVDYQKILLALPERKAAEDSLRKAAESLQQTANMMKAKFDRMIAELNDGKKAGTLSKEYEAMLIDEINDYQGKMQNFQSYAEETLANKEEELTIPMREKVNAAVKTVMKANGVNYVLDKYSFIVIDGGTDLTPLVAKELGITLPPDNTTTGTTPQK